MSKEANLIVVGGTIAAGKSSLVEMLSNEFGWHAEPELRDGDKIQEFILKKLYEGNRIHLATVQYYFLTNRYKQYQDNSETGKLSILDRSVWEDWIFAKLLMKPEPKSYEHYKELWRTTLEKILKRFGSPRAYIFLKVDWLNFKRRIFQRNRQTEVNNFTANQEYFENLLKEYTETFEDILKEWNIPTIVIDTVDKTKEEVFQEATKKLKELGIS